MIPPMRSTSSATGSISNASYVESGCPEVDLGVVALSYCAVHQSQNSGLKSWDM